jgi:hypothetical protein
MKNLFTFFFILLSISLLSQTPQKMSYQAVVRDNDGNIKSNTNIRMKISVLMGLTPVYVETQSAITNVNGLVSLEIGSGTIVSGNFSTINWATGSYFIKTETDPNGGTNYSIASTSQLLSVPYALYSEKTALNYSAGSGISITGNTITNTSPNQNQSLSLSGSTLSITNGNSVNLGSALIYSAGSGISITGNTITNTSPNQNQSLLLNGSTLSITNGNGLNLGNTFGIIGQYQQKIPLSNYGYTISISTISSENDGSKIYVFYYSGNANPGLMLSTYSRDSLTGQYFLSKNEQAGSQSCCPVSESVIIGNNIYLIKGGNPAGIYRTDKTGVNFQLMTLVGSSFNGVTDLFTDGTDLFIYNMFTTTWNRHTISGTSLTNAGTVTGSSVAPGESAMFDGSKIYTYSSNGDVKRWSTINTLENTYKRLISAGSSGPSYTIINGGKFLYLLYIEASTNSLIMLPISKL